VGGVIRAELQSSWTLQHYVMTSYLAVGFVAAITTGMWSLPEAYVGLLLRHAHTAIELAESSWNPAFVRSWFALMLSLAVPAMVAMAAALARGANPRDPEKFLLLGPPFALFCLVLAWGFVDGLGLMSIDPAGRSLRSHAAAMMLAGNPLGLGIFGSLLLFVAAFLASIPFTWLFILVGGKGRLGGR